MVWRLRVGSKSSKNLIVRFEKVMFQDVRHSGVTLSSLCLTKASISKMQQAHFEYEEFIDHRAVKVWQRRGMEKHWKGLGRQI